MNPSFRRSNSFLVILAIWAVVLPASICPGEENAEVSKVSKARNNYWNKMEEAKAAYRKDLAEIVGEGTEVEVFLLDFLMENEKAADVVPGWELEVPEDRFPIAPYHKTSKILAGKKLSAGELMEVMPSLKETVGVQENITGAFCHLPVHGIRVRKGGELLFQSSICYMCSNFYVNYPYADSAEWVGLSSKKFKEVMNTLMPIPKEEMDRFNAIHGKKDKKEDSAKEEK